MFSIGRTWVWCISDANARQSMSPWELSELQVSPCQWGVCKYRFNNRVEWPIDHLRYKFPDPPEEPLANKYIPNGLLGDHIKVPIPIWRPYQGEHSNLEDYPKPSIFSMREANSLPLKRCFNKTHLTPASEKYHYGLRGIYMQYLFLASTSR